MKWNVGKKQKAYRYLSKMRGMHCGKGTYYQGWEPFT